MAVQDYELLLRVRADLQEAIKGMNGLASSIGGVEKSADAAGESADDATARIKKMVAATSEQVQVQESARSQAERAAQTANATIRNYDAEAAAVKRAAQAAADYRAKSSAGAGGNAAVAGLEAERAAMAKLAGQIDPTVAALSKLDAQEKQLNALRKAGVVGLEDYTAFKALIDKSRTSITGAANAMHTFSLNTSQSRLEIGRLIKDLATGNFGRLEQTSLTLAGQSGLTSLLFSPTGLAIGAVVGALGTFAIAAESAAAENDKLNQSIQQTGNYAGTTVGQINQLAEGLSTETTSVGEARDILNQLVSSGRVGSEALGALGQAAVDMAELTGESAEKAADAVLKMFDGTSASALKANEQYHFLTTSIYEQIKALEEEGDTQAAMDVAAEAFHRSAQQRIEQMNEQLSGLAKTWDAVKSAAAGAWERMKIGAGVVTGSADDQTKLYALLGQKAEAEQGGYSTFGNVLNTVLGSGIVDKIPGTKATFSASQAADLQKYQASVSARNEAADNAAASLQLRDAAVKADAALDKLSAAADPADAKKEKVKELNKYFNDLWGGADPNNAKLQGVQRIVGDNGDVSFSGGRYDKLLDSINATGSVRGSGKGVQNAAVEAQQQLIKLLGDEQGALDPAAKAWATYNDAVTKANDLANKAKEAKGADNASIDAQRDALIQLYATARDKSIAAISDKDREAWEKLKDSLRTPPEVALDKALDDIKQLNDLLGKTPITASEYQTALNKIAIQNTAGAAGTAPQFAGLDAVVGGSNSELDKINRAQQEEDEYYAKSLAANAAFREQQKANEEAYNAADEATEQQHQDRLFAIQRARTEATIAGLTSAFSQMAAATKEGFGEQSNAYKAAFALSKAAAIAQATLNMQVDISNASRAGITPIDKAIYIAQAVAESVSIIAAIRSTTAEFDTGGYTGPGGKYQPAGIVHAGEFVHRQEVVRQPGALAFLTDFNNRGMAALPGYASGGLVDARPEIGLPAGSSNASTGADGKPGVEVVIHNNSGTQATVKQGSGANGQQLLEVFISAVSDDISKGGRTSRALEQRYQLGKRGNNYG